MGASTKPDTDVIIVGAGPVGLTLAVDLARRGVALRIVDAAEGPAAQSRALAMHPRTLQVIEQLELLDQAEAQGRRLAGARFVADGRELAHIRIDGIDGSFPYSLNIEQSMTERILAERLAGMGIEVERRVRLVGLDDTGQGVRAVLEREGKPETLSARHLVGCDGARSATRRLLGLSFEGATEEESYLLADCSLAFAGAPPPDDEMTAYLGARSRLILGPLTAPNWRVIITLPNDDPRMPAGDPTLEQLQAMIDRDNPDAGIRMSKPVWLSHFRVNTRMVDRFRSGRCFVAGDAAHIHSPTGGQGMNTGMQDAFNLGWKLSASVHGKPDADALLDSYDAERRPIAARVLKATHLVDSLITGKHGAIYRSARDAALPAIASLGPVHEKIVAWLAGSDVEYQRSPAISYTWPGASPKPGEVAPDADGIEFRGKPTSTLNRLAAGELGHRALVFTGRAGGTELQLLREEAERLAQLGGPDLSVTLVSDRELTPDTIVDAKGEMGRRFAVGAQPTLILVRPDGYISSRSSPPDFAEAAGMARDPAAWLAGARDLTSGERPSVGTIALAGVFALSGLLKILPGGPFEKKLREFGLQRQARIAIGLAEIAGAAGLLDVRTRRLAATGLVGLSGAAAATHVANGEPAQASPAAALLIGAGAIATRE